ncbi:MAG: GTP cyclohydrolase, FolE2/MptA family [Bacteroidota bacterium]
MKKDKRFIVDVGMKDLPFPIKVASKTMPDGQPTIGNISINAHIMHEFETSWIDKFIQIVHQHREVIGTSTLSKNILDYVREFNDAPVRIDFEYPFFVEKLTPVSKEKCLVRYRCTYSAKASSIQKPKVLFKIEIPVLTTYPQSTLLVLKRLFAQLSVVVIEVESSKEIFAEDLVELVDKHALAPIYSFLTPEDQDFIIQKAHKESKTSLVMVDEIKDELAHKPDIEWYSVKSSNFGMLHSYSTIIGTEKSAWVPYSDFGQELDREFGA